jgi:hypothetical protein
VVAHKRQRGINAVCVRAELFAGTVAVAAIAVTDGIGRCGHTGIHG